MFILQKQAFKQSSYNHVIKWYIRDIQSIALPLSLIIKLHDI